mmetsp:Transcript_42689/g.68527  ORF Transcript_42689/g.68527 Transcript_42689/m.68527 type:complete len:173 (-) Transcript_42689:22-540(-)|eukprot:CAMPEP_0197042770 /NCGR_PEP_ID=MMETSP1384-20130603/19104_1 /TAXON_ID=29189 /ORGANISM="Ammonia sp." /LENGTH=172 /DNA_ID=CAMNT_0042473945 /DNA_START=40 /DNA_END=558 /DNA_ORIENTATION=-
MSKDDRLSTLHYTARLFVWFTHTAVCVSAIAIAMLKGCVAETQMHMVLEPHTYLAVGGIVGLIESMLVARWMFNIREKTQTHAIEQSCALAFDLPWSAVGCLLDFQLSPHCAHSQVGSMIFAFVVTKWIYAAFRCYFMISAFNDSEYEKQALLGPYADTSRNDARYGTMQKV